MDMEDDPTEASRPLLIFNHNPKAGGGSIVATLREIKPREMLCVESSKPRLSGKLKGKTVYDGASYGSDVYREALSKEDVGVDEVFFHVREGAMTSRFDRRRGFVIGSIREPCAQYLSLWTFASKGGGTFRQRFAKNNYTESEWYGQSVPYFNSTSDKERFRAWAKHPFVAGAVGQRVKGSYGEAVLDAVDCWVFVEDFQDSLVRCLRMYEDQGGVVDWEAPTVASLLERGTEGDRRLEGERVSRCGALRGPWREWAYLFRLCYKWEGKNDPLGDPRSGHHGKCESMFDAETAKQVETTESFVYDLFGYEGCCKPGTNLYPREENRVPKNYDGEAEYAANSTGSFQLDMGTVKNLSPFKQTNGTTIACFRRESHDGHTIVAVVAVATITGILLLTFQLFLRRQKSKLVNPGGDRQLADIVRSVEADLSAAEDRNLLDEDGALKPRTLCRRRWIASAPEEIEQA